MRASGYPAKAMYTNLIGSILNAILAPVFLFGFGWGVRGAAIATDISMAITATWVMSHFFNKNNVLHFTHGAFKMDWKLIKSVLYIGMAPFMINVANSGVNAVINTSLLEYGGDNAVAAVVVLNRYATVFIFIIIGICQGMQPIVGYNYGAKSYDRLFSTLRLAIAVSVIVTCIGSLALFNPRPIAHLFMQDEAQILSAVGCLKITLLCFCLIGFQIVVTNFFQALGKAGRSLFLSLTRQVIFLIPLLFILPSYMGLKGIWVAFPISDAIAFVVAALVLWHEVAHIKKVEALTPTSVSLSK